MKILPFEAGQIGTAEALLLGTEEPVTTIVDVGEPPPPDPIPPLTDAKEL